MSSTHPARASSLCYAVGLVALSFMTACTFGQASQTPQSHFAFPNSNVIPIGQAEGSTSKLCGLLFITWGSPDADDQEEAVQDALSMSGGDLLINVRIDSSTFFFPYLFSICSTSVRGTAARMEVGRQELGPLNRGAQPPPTQPPPAGPAWPPRPGCTSDAQCKGNRVCSAGQCVSP